MAEKRKACSVCMRKKPLSSFYANSKGKFGRQAKCIPCDNADRVRRSRGPEDRTPNRPCHLCYGISDRVFDGFPELQKPGRKCPSCGLAYAPEKEPTVTDMLELPHENRKALG